MELRKAWGKNPDPGEVLYEDGGIGSRYRALVNRHYIAIEKELENPKASSLYTAAVHLSGAETGGTGWVGLNLEKCGIVRLE